MRFKNPFEERCFQIASGVLGPSVVMEHNKRLQIESALFPEVAAFKGPPTKEIDVLVAQLVEEPKVALLISCKDFARRAEPAHVQEWTAVVRTMNTYSPGTIYLGIIVSAKGFSDGCEAWATSHNLELIPPLKGKKLSFSPETVFRMLERCLIGLRARALFNPKDLAAAPAFFDFVYSLVADFEGHEEVLRDARYFVLPQRWVSSFGEMYSTLAGHEVQRLTIDEDGGTILSFLGGLSCRFTGSHIEFGTGIPVTENTFSQPWCSKNVEGVPCALDFIRSVVSGTRVTSAADFGDYLEFGLDGRLNLGLHLGDYISSQRRVLSRNIDFEGDGRRRLVRYELYRVEPVAIDTFRSPERVF